MTSINNNIMRDAANVFLDDKNSYLGGTLGDIKEIILLYLINSTEKIQSIEQINEICSNNTLYAYRLCDNVLFWELLWTKNISNKIPDPEKLIIILLERKIISNYFHTKDDTLNKFSVLRTAYDYIKNKNRKNYVRDLYKYALNYYKYDKKNILKTLKFNILLDKVEKNDNAFILFYNDIQNGVNIKDIIEKNYWNDIDFVYDNPNIFIKAKKLMEDVVLQRFKMVENKAHNVTNYIDILVKKGFNINQMFIFDSGDVVNFLGYSIINLNNVLFVILLNMGADINQVSPGISALSLLMDLKSKSTSFTDLTRIDKMISALDNFIFMSD